MWMPIVQLERPAVKCQSAPDFPYALYGSETMLEAEQTSCQVSSLHLMLSSE